MLPRPLLLFFAATALALASSPKKLTPREERALAFKAQRPLHTTALLAGAAATPAANHNDLRVRDLRTVTGEDGLWVHLNDIESEDEDDDDDAESERNDEREGDEETYGRRVKEQVVIINRREGWDGHAGEA